MPVDMPPNKKPDLSTAAPFNLLGRSLNWLAVAVAVGLLLWTYKLGFPPI